MEMEQYLWEESDTSGQFLRNEEGQRMSVGYTSDNMGWNHPGILYEISGKGILGVVYYRDADPMPMLGVTTETLASKADYIGTSISGNVGQRYGFLAEPYMLEVMVGVEIDAWGRNIRTEVGSGIGRGVKEAFLVVSPSLSAGMTGWWGRRRHRMLLGIKHPAIIERINLSAIGSLQPSGFPMPFGHMELTRVLDVFSYWLNIRLFFDSRFINAAGPHVNYRSDRAMQWNGGIRITLDKH